MTQIRISQAAALLNVSDDTVRRWVDAGRLSKQKNASGITVVDGAELAALAADTAPQFDAIDARAGERSARNHLTGLVLSIKRGDVLSQVELQCGLFHITSVITTDAVDALALEPGSVATALVKSTDVQIERSPL